MKKPLFMAAALALVILSSACSNPTEAPTRNLRRPIAMAAACLVGTDLGDCSDPDAYGTTLWILDADRNALAVLDFDAGRHLDTDPFVPGFNSITLGEDLVDMAMSRDSTLVYVLSRRARELIRVDTTSLEITRQATPCESASFVLVDKGPLVKDGSAGVALLACPDPAGLAVVGLGDDFGTLDPSAMTILPVEGMPWKLDVDDEQAVAYVVHGPSRFGTGGTRLSYMSRVDLEDGTTTAAGISPACSDGIDNDSDGAADNADPGCAGPDDRDETDTGTGICDDGLDNDGDGFTDMKDPDCGNDPDVPFSEFHLVPWPACMNLKDDDGDGLTDFPQDPDCYGTTWKSESSPNPSPAGRPTVSSDGAFVYVPVSGPHMVMVFDTDPFERIDVTAPDGPAPNSLLNRLGYTGIRLTVPPVEMVMARSDTYDEQGNPDGEVGRAFVSLSSGQVVRIVVDRDGEPVHDLDLAAEQLQSTAGVPVLRVDGEVVDRTVDLHPEYPSFGPRTVDSVPGTEEDVFSYYGIVFNGDHASELSETWRVTWEGVLPGATGKYGFRLDPGNLLADPTADFCSAGVLAGDHVVLYPPPPACQTTVEGTVTNICEFGIAAVGPGELELEALEGLGSLELLASLPAPVSWEIRAAGSWTVVGSKSGFLHNRVEEAGACIDAAGGDPGFTGRAYTSLPFEPDGLEDCPPLEDDPSIDWREFRNVAFRFRLFTPCRTDDEFQTTVAEVPRGLELSFVAAGGRTPLVNGPGGILKGLTIAGPYLYFADATRGAVYQVDMDTMALVKTVF